MAADGTTQQTPKDLKLARFSLSTIKNEKLEKENTSLSNKQLYDVRNYLNFRSSKNDGPTTKLVSNSFLCSTGDFNYSEHFNMDESAKPLIATLIINEFQPFSPFYGKERIIYSGIKALISKSDILTLGAELVKSSITEHQAIFKNALLNLASVDPASLYSNGYTNSDGKFVNNDDNPITAIRNIFNSGRWLNTYEIPFYGNQYLKSDTNQYWQNSGLGAIFGKDTGEFLKNNLSIDVPTQPTFTIGDMRNSSLSSNRKYVLSN